MQSEAVYFETHSPLTQCHSFLSSYLEPFPVELKITVPQVTTQYIMLPVRSQVSN